MSVGNEPSIDPESTKEAVRLLKAGAEPSAVLERLVALGATEADARAHVDQLIALKNDAEARQQQMREIQQTVEQSEREQKAKTARNTLGCGAALLLCALLGIAAGAWALSVASTMGLASDREQAEWAPRLMIEVCAGSTLPATVVLVLGIRAKKRAPHG